MPRIESAKKAMRQGRARQIRNRAQSSALRTALKRVRAATTAEPLLPIAIRLDLINENRSLLSTVAAEIGLSVAIDVQALDTTTALYRLLPDGGAHGSSAPRDVARQPNVNGE